MSTDTTVLPDGSAVTTISVPLPEDHWLYAHLPHNPPAGMRTGTADPRRQELADAITAAARYAVRGATMRGKSDSFDPDALVQNMVVGLLGYWTPDGTSTDDLDRSEKPARRAPFYRRKPTRVEAVQLTWKTWSQVCDFLGDIISPAYPARNVDTFGDTCGESAPYIELTIPTEVGPEIARHGDWIVRDPDGLFYVVPRRAFAYSYQKV